MKENIMATNLEPHECVIFVQSTKIGTHENKSINSIDEVQNGAEYMLSRITLCSR